MIEHPAVSDRVDRSVHEYILNVACEFYYNLIYIKRYAIERMVYRILMFFLGRNFVSSLNLYTKSTKPKIFF